MNDVTVKLDWETVDNIITTQLKENLVDLERDLENRKEGYGIGVFHTDAAEDAKEITRHVEALKTVLEFYGCPRAN